MMVERLMGRSWQIPWPQIAAGGLAVSGLLLASISWWFFLLTGLAISGPGILRELGWLHDKDEFQRRAEQRAGYHAFLVAGLIASLGIAYFRSGERGEASPADMAALFLSLLWFTWFLSYLTSYWGPKKTARRILISFGIAWLLFVILSNTGSQWSGWLGLLMQSLLVIPYFASYWTASRWPRLTGIMLLATAATLFWFLGLFQHPRANLVGQAVTFTLFLGPLIAGGIALLTGHAKAACE